MTDKQALFEARKAAAIAQNWIAEWIGGVYFIQSSNGDYSWLGDTEYLTWYELLMDDEIYNELTELLGVG